MNWRKWNRAIHRDFGYLFFGLTMVYALSGIALNHRNEWNPNFVVIEKAISEAPFTSKPGTGEVKGILKKYGVEDDYRKHYFPSEQRLKIFLRGGTAEIDLTTGNGQISMTRSRLVFREVNYLHYNPVKSWTVVSDIYAGALILLSLTGILIPRGGDGLSGRGWWMTLLGLLVPLGFIIYYLY
ncbi:MAG TPA: PepSY-associated TM helix domain-containing protein [Bacteroidales bacterium]|nr:PepSY-associated TM helix domain-containing protein [Bacteroidales bacterium]